MDERAAALLASALPPSACERLVELQSARVLVPDGRSGAALIALFDFLEVAYNAYRLIGAPWKLERLEVDAIEADAIAQTEARRAVNEFWGWDPEMQWHAGRRDDRLPVFWACRLTIAPLEAGGRPSDQADGRHLDPADGRHLDQADGRRVDPAGGRHLDQADGRPYDLILDACFPTKRPERAQVPLAIPDPDRAAARFFLARFFGERDFEPGHWEAVSSVLAGRPVLLCGDRTTAEPAYRLPARLLPGATLVVTPSRGERPMPDLREIGADGAWPDIDPTGADKGFLVSVPAFRLQDQRFLQKLRHALRLFPGGLAMVVVTQAERASIWSPDFEPAYTRLPDAVQEIGARPGTPILALTGQADQRVLSDIAAAFRIPGHRSQATLSTPSAPPTVPTSAPTAPAPLLYRFPGWRLEAELARRQLVLLARPIASGGFATVPTKVRVSLDVDSGRADRFRGFLSRLQALGFVTGFGENATEFLVKHAEVSVASMTAYLEPIATRAATKVGAPDPAELAGLGPVDLCELLVQSVLGRDALEARRTALFFDCFVCPHLGQIGAIAIPKRPQPDEAVDFELEPLLYRLAQLDVVREYFLDFDGTLEQSTWKVAFRKPDPAVMATSLGRLYVAWGLAKPPVVESVADYVGLWLQGYYQAVLPHRLAASRPNEAMPALEATVPMAPPAVPIGPIAAPDAYAGFAVAADLATFEPAAVVDAYANRRQLGTLRDRAAAAVISNPGAIQAGVVLALSLWALGDPEAACDAISTAIDVALADSARERDPIALERDVLADPEALLSFCPPPLRVMVLEARRAPLADSLGERRFRQLLHDAYAACDRHGAADSELLAALLPVSAGWQSASGELEPLQGLLGKLESGCGPLDYQPPK